MTANSVFSWQNNVKGAAITAIGAVAAGLGPDQLQNDQGSSACACRFLGTNPHLVIDLPAAGTWRALALARTNLTPAATVQWVFQAAGTQSTVVYDTGVLPAGVMVGYGQSVVVLPADVTARTAQVIVQDPGNTDGFTSIPLAHAGPAWIPATNFSFDSTVGRDDQVDEATTRGGQEFPVWRWARRRWSVVLGGVRRAEAWTTVMELDRLGRTGGNVLFVPNPTSPDIGREAVYGRFTPKSDLSWPYMGADRRQYSADITERL